MSERKAMGLVIGCVLTVALGITSVYGGKESRRKTFDPPFSSTDRGHTLGSRRFYALAGSTIDVNYNVRISRGGFWIYVKRMKPGLNADGSSWHIASSGSGVRSAVLSESGLYWIRMDGESTRGSTGYEVDYTVNWRIHPKWGR